MTDPAESAEDIEAKELMAKWEKEMGDDPGATATDDDSLEDSGPLHYDDDLEKYRRDVNPKDGELDHMVLATADLDKAMEEFEKETGVKPVMVCSLNGLGTKSARVAFDECCFLEIVAPDPKQTNRPLGDKLVDVAPPGVMVPLHYAVRDSNAAKYRDTKFPELGYKKTDQVTMVAKDRGMPWKWDMVFLEGHDDGGLVPFFVDWGDAHHAAGRLPVVGSGPRVTVKAPSDHRVHKLLDDVVWIDTDESDDVGVSFAFTGKDGQSLSYSGRSPVGISFPQEGGLPVKKGT